MDIDKFLEDSRYLNNIEDLRCEFVIDKLIGRVRTLNSVVNQKFLPGNIYKVMDGDISDLFKLSSHVKLDLGRYPDDSLIIFYYTDKHEDFVRKILSNPTTEHIEYYQDFIHAEFPGCVYPVILVNTNIKWGRLINSMEYDLHNIPCNELYVFTEILDRKLFNDTNSINDNKIIIVTLSDDGLNEEYDVQAEMFDHTIEIKER